MTIRQFYFLSTFLLFLTLTINAYAIDECSYKVRPNGFKSAIPYDNLPLHTEEESDIFEIQYLYDEFHVSLRIGFSIEECKNKAKKASYELNTIIDEVRYQRLGCKSYTSGSGYIEGRYSDFYKEVPSLPLCAYLKVRANDLGITHRVIDSGYVQFDEKDYYFSTLDEKKVLLLDAITKSNTKVITSGPHNDKPMFKLNFIVEKKCS